MKYQIKDIQDFPGYRIDTNGDVWSCWKRNYKKGVTGSSSFLSHQWSKRKPFINMGREVTSLYKNKKQYHKFNHRLVLEAFIGKCPNSMEACHNNGNASDNRLENLRWDTPKNNHADKLRHGTHNRGEQNKQAKLTVEDVRLIKDLRKDSNLSQKRIGKIFGVCQSAISSILIGKNWNYGSIHKRG